MNFTLEWNIGRSVVELQIWRWEKLRYFEGSDFCLWEEFVASSKRKLSDKFVARIFLDMICGLVRNLSIFLYL